MDLWNTFQKELLHANLGLQELRLSSGERHNCSLASIEGRNAWVQPGEQLFQGYSEQSRYLAVKNLAFDLLLTIYDVNSPAIAAVRVKDVMPKSLRTSLQKLFPSSRKHNLELRAIGLQNGHKELLRFVEYVHGIIPCKIAEVDLFGTNLRHVVIDTKTGMPYNLLLQNRIYRPGELLNTTTMDEVVRAVLK